MYTEATLLLVWNISWVLSLMSLAVFTVLIVIRYIDDSNTTAYDKRYAELQEMLLIHLETPLSELKKTFVQQKHDLSILAILVQKILRSTISQGKEQRVHSFIYLLGLEEWVYSQAKKGNKQVRMAAIQLIGYLAPNEKHNQILIDILEQERNFHLRYTVVESLSRLGNIQNFPNTLKVLQEDEVLSPLLIYDIFRRFGADACDKLIEVACSKATTNSKIAAIRALGDIPTQKSRDSLIAHCYSDNDEICANTFYALSNIALPIANDAIAHGAKHSFWKVRMYATKCAQYAENFPIETLQTLLEDENWMISIQAAEALYSYGAAGQRILEMIADNNSITAQRAASFLIEKERKTNG